MAENDTDDNWLLWGVAMLMLDIVLAWFLMNSWIP